MRLFSFMRYLKLVILALIFIAPFLNFMHYNPVQDWWTNALVVTGAAIAAISMVFIPRHQAAIPISGIVIVLFFGSVIVAGYSLHANPVSLNVLLGCMLVLLVLTCHWQTLVSQGRLDFICQLSQILFVGGLLQVLLGVIQVFGLAPLFNGYVMYDASNPAGNIMGNIAQRNLYGHYLTWALFASCYLYAVGRLRVAVLLMAQLLFSLLIAWSGGRLILGYIALGLLLGGFWYWRARNSLINKHLLIALISASLMVILTQTFLSQFNHFLSWLGLKVELQSGVERFFDHGFGARRYIEWSKAWQIFTQHPLLGLGWDGYAFAGNELEVYGGFPKVPESWLFANCHNLIFQLLAETGVLGSAIVLIGFIVLLRPYFIAGQASPENLLLMLLLAVTMMHSMFEYPLWYLPFLSMLVLIMACSPIPPVTLPSYSRVVWLAYLVCGLLFGVYVVLGVGRFNLLVRESMPVADIEQNKLRIGKLAQLTVDPLWGDDASLALARFMTPSREKAEIKLKIYEQLLYYRPMPFILQNSAMLNALTGRQQQALKLIKQFIVVYPDLVPALCIVLSQQVEPEYASMRIIANKACAISEQYPGAENDERRRLAIVNAFAAPVTRKALF